MIRVIVADDEVKVCRLICSLVDWKTFNMEIVGVAHNGVEALELIQDKQPDLIVTDIRMPGCDGLELIERARQLKEGLSFIIISGYRHFDYAQSAIKFGVSDYLLKPIKKEELSATLEKMKERYQKRQAQRSEEAQLRQRLKSDIGRLRSGLFRLLLEQEELWANEAIDGINTDYHFKFSPGYFQAFVIKIDSAAGGIPSEGMKILEDKISSQLRTSLTTDCFDMELFFDGCWGYGLMNFDPDRRAIVRRQLKSGFGELLIQVQILFEQVDLTIGLGAPYEQVCGLTDSLSEARLAVSGRLLTGAGRLLEDLPAQGDAMVSDALLAELTRTLGSALDVLDRVQVIGAFELLHQQATAPVGVGASRLYRLALDGWQTYLTLLRNRKLGGEEITEAVRTFAETAQMYGSARELFNALEHMVTESIDTILLDRRQAQKKPIRDAKQYIQENYMNSISLEEVADQVSFNPSYFSTLFKKESGSNFQEYLFEVRMDKAKELLRESKLTVACICTQVGYSDLKHFTQSFKKHTGLKPNEFRKLYG